MRTVNSAMFLHKVTQCVGMQRPKFILLSDIR
jgi:hypothetical protein